ncbi:universal stress protein [Massilia sp. CF038]|uniref:universal stress protein n=1 Tax=Massilia sp. CF038 TaxID=1881045 RepID=UPI00090EEB05|nr:universal stress protein [Massilia sp. CF038]SHG61839.1 Nucleotide-binding universal stress protein, UspA family [Massilia sp. CF038]
MNQSKKMLLVTSEACLSQRAALRAALLSGDLQLDGFDMLNIKRSALGLCAGNTEYSQIEVRGHAVSAWIDGKRTPVDVLDDANVLAPIWHTARSTAAELVAETARAQRAELTVLAPQRRHSLLALLAPSHSRAILRQSQNSVLFVHCEPRDVYRKVLVAVDFSAECDTAARLALALAPEAHFTFMHAFSFPEAALMRELEVPSSIVGTYLARACESAWARLDKWIENLGPLVQPYVAAVHSGLPVPVINANARRIGADLIVVGRQGRARNGRYGLGDVPRKLGARAACDVLIGPALTTASVRGATTWRGLAQHLRAEESASA